MEEFSLTTQPIPGVLLPLNQNYALMITEFGGQYEVYARKQKENECDTPWLYMFGFPVAQQPIEEVIDMAVCNLEDYEFMFTD